MLVGKVSGALDLRNASIRTDSKLTQIEKMAAKGWSRKSSAVGLRWPMWPPAGLRYTFTMRADRGRLEGRN